MEDPVSAPTSQEKQARAKPAAAPARLTRAQVATRLGVSISKVRTMEGKKLHPLVENGVHYFEAAEVDAAARSAPARSGRHHKLTDGQIAARVFYMLEHGKELREIVQELEITPDLVRRLHRDWIDDFEGGEERRQRAEKEAKEARELAAANRAADREQRDWQRTMAAIVGKEGG